MKQLIIVGAGGLGREVACWALDAKWNVAGFLDDNPKALVKIPMPIPILGSLADFVPRNGLYLVIAIGQPSVRRSMQASFLEMGAQFANIIHPTAVVAQTARLGIGLVIAPFSLISAHTLVGDGVVLNYHTVIQHDAEVGAWSQLNSHADVGPSSILGEEVLVGTHAVIPPRVRVPSRSLIAPNKVFLETGA